MGDCYNESRNRFRQSRIEAGLCRDCGLVPPIAGKVVCADCSKKRSENGGKYRKNKIFNGICSLCNKINDRPGKRLCSTCTELQVEKSKKRRRNVKLLVVAHFGGSCSICGENDLRCLCLHHVNEDGFEDRKANNSKGKMNTVDFYARLARKIKNDEMIEPPLELLCLNCHAKRHGEME